MLKKLTYAILGALTLTSAANAAPPDLSAAQTVFADAGTSAETLFGYALPVIGSIMILFMVTRLVKRFGRQVA